MDGPLTSKPRDSLLAMLSHAAVHSPYYREQDWAARLRAGETIGFREIPITPKTLVRAGTDRFYASFVPPEDGNVQDKPTSGSSGEPMLVRKTQRHFDFNSQENRRLHSGWGLDRLARRVQFKFPNDEHPPGTLEEEALPDGRHRWDFYSLDPRAVFDLLRQTGASMVSGPPSLILGALEESAEARETLPLRAVATFSEVVPDELRELVRQIPDCRLVDNYGCVEAGLIAVQCPRCDAYHPAGRHLVFELLGEDGRPVEPGAMGRVVVTPLFNRATPLVRYETGDYATRTQKSDCPRARISIERIVGREKNLFKLPNGRRIMPLLPPRIADRLGMRRFKFFQTTLTDIELHYIPRADDGEIPEHVAQDLIDKYMSPDFRVRCIRVSDIPRAPSGKFLMYECLV